ncbi:MAG: hypothetical protein VX777_04755 [Chlamydiota bacterium]|nr:hypothetical protein [Chlamydiota bacterium]
MVNIAGSLGRVANRGALFTMRNSGTILNRVGNSKLIQQSQRCFSNYSPENQNNINKNLNSFLMSQNSTAYGFDPKDASFSEVNEVANKTFNTSNDPDLTAFDALISHNTTRTLYPKEFNTALFENFSEKTIESQKDLTLFDPKAVDPSSENISQNLIKMGLEENSEVIAKLKEDPAIKDALSEFKRAQESGNASEKQGAIRRFIRLVSQQFMDTANTQMNHFKPGALLFWATLLTTGGLVSYSGLGWMFKEYKDYLEFSELLIKEVWSEVTKERSHKLDEIEETATEIAKSLTYIKKVKSSLETAGTNDEKRGIANAKLKLIEKALDGSKLEILLDYKRDADPIQSLDNLERDLNTLHKFTIDSVESMKNINNNLSLWIMDKVQNKLDRDGDDDIDCQSTSMESDEELLILKKKRLADRLYELNSKINESNDEFKKGYESFRNVLAGITPISKLSTEKIG